MAKQVTKKKLKKVKLSPQEKAAAKLKLDHKKLVRSVLAGTGFVRVPGVSDKEFSYDNQASDFDDVFVQENIILLVEYTTSQASSVGSHLKNKKIIYDKIVNDPPKFIEFLRAKFPVAADKLASGYHRTKLIVKILYCSRFDFEQEHRANVPSASYFNYGDLRYFASVVGAIRKSARFELMHFLKIDPTQIGHKGGFNISGASNEYHGSILPEAHSNFQDGYKVVSFYADPDVLLRTSYVLRADGWRDSLNVYQRMISRAKVEGIRAYLKREKRVFINNIIVTLPSDVKPLDEGGNTIDPKTLTDTAPVRIKLPHKANSVGLIDGQHRVFAYYEANNDDEEIASLRRQQNLLVTGIIYPARMTDAAREKFEAKLFLEINSNQTSANSKLKQAIGMVLDPFSNESVAARTLSGLARKGPLEGCIQQYFYDTDKLKTSSIVSYGLRPLVKTKGDDSIFKVWKKSNKNDLLDKSDDELLGEYVDFCVSSINDILIAIKRRVGSRRWTTSKDESDRVLTTTYVNSFLIVLRNLILRNEDIGHNNLYDKLDGIQDFDFYQYSSSQYNAMAHQIIDNVYDA
ncbi:DGQHR domain-containing protein [Sphingomonas sanguinis]|uniref:DGQHR domain-containing protein n=1 Tax=Sphingomonas sanguinis TaxID=33051 RepID=UPI0009E81AE5|nr:DGQHR domain-containing protein [Sphingomonas sanguinis]